MINSAFKNTILLCVMLAYCSFSYGQCQPSITTFKNCNFTPYGHRGYSAVFPENSLLSLEELFKHGVKYAEVDISLTKDDRYVLFHDETSVYRTTNASGDLSDYTLSEVQQWDLGSWRGKQFAGIRIPTLEEALLLAEKYDAHLYLDNKDYEISALKNALQTSGAAPNRLMPSLNTIDNAKEFRKEMPNTPWVWYDGGYLPPNINYDTFYKQCMDLGCAAFEVSTDSINTSQFITFRDKVHQYGGKVLVFTINEDSRILDLYNRGADAIESDRAWEASKLVCDGKTGTTYDSATTGNWIFNGNLSGTGVGSQMRNLNYANPPAGQVPLFASCSVFGLANVGSSNKVVMKVPALAPENGLLVFTNYRIEDHGISDISFTVIMDLLLPTTSVNHWVSLFQTTTTNSGDGDLFINPSGGVGTVEQYHGHISSNTWTRLAFTVDGNAGLLKKYINGAYVGASQINSSRWSVWNSSRRGDDQGFLIFSDDNNETADMYMSAMQIRNYVMDSASILKLGDASAGFIKMGNADSWFASLDIAYPDSTLLDYENRTFYMVIPSNSTADSAFLSYKISDGATASIPLQKKISIAPMNYSWQVTSQDGLKKLNWKICIRKANTVSVPHTVKKDLSFEIFPNPAHDRINIVKSVDGTSVYKIFDMFGRELKNGIFSGQMQFDISSLRAGIYWITISENEKSSTKKFVVE